MVRTVNQREREQRQRDIVEAARRLVYAKGYQRMTIADIRSLVGLSNGAFFHYFTSKPAVLEALAERVGREAAASVAPGLSDPELSPVTKLQLFFSNLDHLRSAHQDVVVELLRTWYTDDNVLVRERVDVAVREHRGPLLTEVIREGVGQGSFSTSRPDLAADIVLTLIARLGAAQARSLLRDLDAVDRSALIEEILDTRDEFVTAVERVLAAPTGCLTRGTPEAVEAWLEAVHPEGAR